MHNFGASVHFVIILFKTIKVYSFSVLKLKTTHNAGVTLSRIWKQMNTQIWNFAFRAKVAPNLVNNQSIADANTMPTDGYTTVAELHTMAAEPHTKAAERCNFSTRQTSADSYLICSLRNLSRVVVGYWMTSAAYSALMASQTSLTIREIVFGGTLKL